MPTYIYKARDETGKSVKGTMDAVSQEQLAEKLRNMGYMTTHIKEAFPGIPLEDITERFKRVRIEDIIIFNVQLANMIDAGLPLLSSLRTISDQIENKKLREIVGEVSRSVEGGSSFSDALAKYPKVFSKLFVNTVMAGETSGKLNIVLNRLAIYVEQQEDLRQQVKGALFYPAILFFSGLTVIIFIVSFVMPKFVAIFTEANVALPLPTLILYGTGVALKKFWYMIILGIGCLIFGIKRYANTEEGRLRVDQLKLRVPIIGPLVRKVIISRFSRMLATLVESGVPLLQSLDIIKEVVGNEVIGRVVQNVRDGVEGGERIAQLLKIGKEFPPDMVQMIAVGEETGNLGYMLNKIADFYDTAIGYAIKKLTALIEPIFLVIMGIMVAFIMASMLMPIFDMVRTLRH